MKEIQVIPVKSWLNTKKIKFNKSNTILKIDPALTALIKSVAEEVGGEFCGENYKFPSLKDPVIFFEKPENKPEDKDLEIREREVTSNE
jgi:hypothetical protein